MIRRPKESALMSAAHRLSHSISFYKLIKQICEKRDLLPLPVTMIMAGNFGTNGPKFAFSFKANQQ